MSDELTNLKSENSNLANKANQVHAGAIDALVEKEQKILELNETLAQTETFYKGQLESAREEIKNLQNKLITSDAPFLITKLEKESDDVILFTKI